MFRLLCGKIAIIKNIMIRDEAEMHHPLNLPWRLHDCCAA